MSTRVVPPRDKKAPNSTWHYYQPGYDDPIQAQGYEALIDEMIRFRVNNDLDAGDPEADLEAYLAERFPTRQGARKEHNQRTLIDKVRLWLKLVKTRKAEALKARTPWRLVDQETANKRAAICLACPANTPSSSISLCSPCIEAMDRNSTMITENKRASSPIGACASLSHDNRAAVWLPTEHLTRSIDAINTTTPHACWLRATASST